MCDRVLRADGPALLFEQPLVQLPVLGNLFGPRAVWRWDGCGRCRELRQFGHVLASIKEPETPRGVKELLGLGSMVKTLWHMAPRELRSAPCQEVVWEGSDVDWPVCRFSLLAR